MEKSNKKKFGHSLVAGILALAMILSPVLSSLPAMQAEAAEQQWYHVRTGSGNGNGHAYSNAASKPAAVLLNESPMPTGGELSLTYQKMGTANQARLGVFYCYLDDDNWLYVGCNPGGSWYYEYKVDGSGTYLNLANLQSQSDDSVVRFSMSVNGNVLTTKVNDTTDTVEVEAFGKLMEKAAGKGKYGFRAANFGTEITEFRFADVALGGTPSENNWAFLAACEGQVFEAEKVLQNYSVRGKAVDKDGTALAGASAQIGDTKVVSDTQGNFVFPKITEGSYEIALSLKGYKASRQPITVDQDLDLGSITLLKRSDTVYDTYIESDQIKAAVSTTFPQVMQYEMKTGSETGTKFFGQDEALSVIKINGVNIVPVLAGDTAVLTADKAAYVLNLKNTGASIDMQMTVEISVKENDLTWQVTDITKNTGCTKINSIEVPNLNLVTITEDQADTQFMGTNNSGHVSYSMDEEIHFGAGFKANESKAYSYGFLSADGLSAGVFSNSEKSVKYDVMTGEIKPDHEPGFTDGDSRVLRNNGADSISLTSSLWYYEYGDMPDAANYDHVPVSELPVAKVCLAADLNDDEKADWQDGAIAYRDIMHKPQGAEDVPELVNYRIAMNFASHATHPFLNTADNIKKTYLATDGLEQAVMLKGYGNEGHDSANSEYGDIGERIGGAEDMKKLIEIANRYNAEIGIHVNAQEMYPEAKSFDDKITNTGHAWGWLDQSYGINREYDLGTGLRYKRFLQLYDQLNDTNLYGTKWPQRAGTGTAAQETLPDAAAIQKSVEQSVKAGTNLDFIYLDVWYGKAWETRKVAQQINSLGWRFSTEFGVQGEYDSTWQHWAAEKKYGGVDGKGHNSDVRRFIKNHQTDSFVLNAPELGGAANNPLLGGMDINGFEGWQNNNNFDRYMDHTFGINLPAKFLQHYQVVKWENYPEVDGRSTSPVTNHEKEITLKNEDGDTVIVTRNEEQRKDDFVERTITLNGKEVLNDVRYLLPWNDRNTGEEKLYHWNYDGGTSEWELQDGWADLANVKLYQLSDQGRMEEQIIPVESGKITLTAEPHVAYVLIKGTATGIKKTVSYGEMDYVKDPGFNAYAGLLPGTPLNKDIWSGNVTDESVKVIRRTSGNQQLAMDSPKGDVKVSTTISGLTAGKDYVAQVYVENKSDADASIEMSGVEKTVSNYTGKSLAGNYIRSDAHNMDGVSGSRMQVMLVSFKASSKQATLSLARKAGKGITYFDDIRIIEKKLDNYRADGSFVQDFESVAQGLYPFVLGPAQGVEDPGTHLSQLHAPYTQRGFRGKLMDDVIEGEWSVKQHDTYFKPGLIYRTIPQNFRFKANTTYEVSFDYQTGARDTFAVVLGAGEDTTRKMEYLKTTTTTGETQSYKFLVSGQEDGQTWFGIHSDTSKSKGTNVLGEFDLVLDNLVIKEAPVSLSAANLEVKNVGKAQKLSLRYQDGVKADSVTWSTSDKDIADVDQKGNVSCYAYGSALITATVVIGDETYELSCKVSIPKSEKIEQEKNIKAVYANTEEAIGEPVPNGFASAAIDGNVSTYWHSQWSGSKFNVSESNPAILTFELNEDADAVGGFEFLQRSNANGVVSKFEYIVGDNFNQDTNVLEGKKYGPVTVENPTGGSWVDVEMPEATDSKYIQIRILSGSNGFACMSEFKTYGTIVYEDNKLVQQRGALKDQIAEAKAVVNENYTEQSWNDFQNAIKAAEAFLFGDTSKETIAAEADKLDTAQKALTVDPEYAQIKKDLQEKVDEAKAVQYDNYTDETWNAFLAARTAAEKALEEGVKADMANALQVLADAVKGLTKNPPAVDEELVRLKQELQTKINEAKAVKNNNYTDDSWNVFQNAVKSAETVLSGSSKTDITNAIQALQKAKAGLTVKPAQIQKVKLAAPKISSVKSSIKGVTVKWSAVPGATSYIVMRNGKAIKTVTKTSYVDQNPKGNAVNTYTVIAKGDPAKYLDSAAGKKATKKLPAKAAFRSAKKVGKSQVSLKWKSVKGTKSYTLLRSTKKDGTYKTVKVLKGKITSYTDKRAKGKVVYYKLVVRKGNLYGPASAAKRVKM